MRGYGVRVTRAPRAVALAVGAALLPVSLSLPPAASAAPGPVHTVTVSAVTGTLTQWPAYHAAVDRFAVVPSSAANDSVVVTATTSDPGGTVLVDGRPVISGDPATVTGLTPGDEVSVIIDDAGGHSAQSWVYLPSTFPQLSTTGTLGEGDDHVFLTLGNFVTTTPYEVAVDGNAVPSWFEQGSGSDLKPVDLGATRYAMARKASGGGYRVDELDQRFQTIRSHQLDAVPASTDFHDSELLPDGRTLLLGYDSSKHDDGKTYYDAVIQLVGADGHAVLTWDSKDYVDPSEAYVDGGFGDYAHINSLQYLPASGDILASFRNLGQVMLIAGPNDPHHSTGHVIWRLGGVRNDFTFVDDPYGGNCAQHFARLMPDGHLTLFDNGSRDDQSGAIGKQSADMCPDPANPGGPRIARPQTRITEYALDTTTDPAHPTATLVWQFVPTNRYAAFAGSQQRLSDGTTFAGWSQSVPADGTPTQEPAASLVTPGAIGDGSDAVERWQLFASGWFSYRAAIGPSPDGVDPEVTVASPDPATTYTEGDQVPADFGCTDTGGSSLDTCTGSTADGSLLDTSPGSHVLTVTATDGDGNQTVRHVAYQVAPLSRPDAQVRSAGGTWVGDGVYGGSAHQRVTDPITTGATRTRIRLQNDGVAADTLLVLGSDGNRRFTVSYRHAGRDVTRAVLHGRLGTGPLAPGGAYALTMVLHRTATAVAGDHRRFSVTATSTSPTARHDAVAVIARAQG